jgi:hypothetical protein
MGEALQYLTQNPNFLAWEFKLFGPVKQHLSRLRFVIDVIMAVAIWFQKLYQNFS